MAQWKYLDELGLPHWYLRDFQVRRGKFINNTDWRALDSLGTYIRELIDENAALKQRVEELQRPAKADEEK